MVKVFSVFTGIGSPEMALRNIHIEYEVVGISEVDRYAILAYDAIHCDQKKVIENATREEMLGEFIEKNIAYNFSTYISEIPKSEGDILKLYTAHKRSKNYGDIRKINEKTLPDFDLFSYSFPCKNISIAGSQGGFVEGSNTQSSLLWECERIIRNKKPEYLLMENVKNLISKKHMGEFDRWIYMLDKLGYDSYWSLLNGKHYGVPQNRERVMMVSILKSKNKHTFRMPNSSHCTTTLTDILEKDVPKHFYIDPKKYAHIKESLPSQDLAYCLDANYAKGISVDNFIKRKKRTLIQEATGCAIRGRNGKQTLEVSPTSLSNSITTINKDSLVLLGNELQMLGMLGNKDYATNRVYSENGVSPALNIMNGGNRQPKIAIEKTTDFLVRRLTPRECWRLMGYTDQDFNKARDIGGLSNTKLYERAGRGIVVPMLEAIFTNLFDERKVYITDISDNKRGLFF